MQSPPQVVTSGAQLTLHWTLTGQLGMNVMHAMVTGSIVFGQALANSLGTAIKSAFTTNLASHYHTATGLVRVGIRDISSEGQAEFRDTGATVAGTATADPLPRGTAFVVTLRTARSGKKYTGRVYLPGPAETVNDTQGQQSSAFATAAVAFVTAIDSALAGQQMQLAVFSRPAFAQKTVQTWTTGTGEDIVETLSATAARSGMLTEVSSIVSRTAIWEYQRRRDNGRALPPAALLTPVAAEYLD